MDNTEFFLQRTYGFRFLLTRRIGIKELFGRYLQYSSQLADGIKGGVLGFTFEV